MDGLQIRAQLTNEPLTDTPGTGKTPSVISVSVLNDSSPLLVSTVWKTKAQSDSKLSH